MIHFIKPVLNHAALFGAVVVTSTVCQMIGHC